MASGGGSWFERGAAGLVVAACLYKVSGTIADPDLWGHVRFGLDILRDRRVATVDPYSYLTEGQAWINHEWLAEATFGLAYRAGGAAGLVGLKVSLAIMIVGLIYRGLERQGFGAIRGGVALQVATLGLAIGVGAVRPQVFTYLGFAIVLTLLRRAEDGRVGVLWWVPAVLVAWVNLHGGFLAGVAVFGIWSVVRLGSTGRAGVVGPLIASGLAPLVNPYGPGLVAFLLRTATVPRPEIAEWGPIRGGSVEGVVYLLLLGFAAANLPGRGRGRGRSPATLAVLLATAVLPMVAVRHLPLFAIAATILGGGRLAEGRRDEGRTPIGFGAINLIVACVLVGSSVPNFRAIRVDPGTFAYPARAVALLKAAGAEGNLIVHFDWGEYVRWPLGPGVRVSMDGRRETVYPEATYRAQVALREGRGDWSEVLRDRSAEMALVAREFPGFRRLLGEAGWRLAYEDEVCGLFVRDGSGIGDRIAGVAPPKVAADGAGATFP